MLIWPRVLAAMGSPFAVSTAIEPRSMVLKLHPARDLQACPLDLHRLPCPAPAQGPPTDGNAMLYTVQVQDQANRPGFVELHVQILAVFRKNVYWRKC